jgi:hypothetical protein
VNTPRFELGDQFLFRLSLLPMTVAADLRSDRGRLLLHRIADLDAKVAADRDRISAVLFGEIGGETDPASRRDLIALRRDLFSYRRPKDGSRTADLLIRLSVTQPDLLGFVRSLDERAHCVREFGEVFDSDRDAIRRRLSASPNTRVPARVAVNQSPRGSGRLSSIATIGRDSGKPARTERGLLRYSFGRR